MPGHQFRPHSNKTAKAKPDGGQMGVALVDLKDSCRLTTASKKYSRAMKSSFSNLGMLRKELCMQQTIRVGFHPEDTAKKLGRNGGFASQKSKSKKLQATSLISPDN